MSDYNILLATDINYLPYSFVTCQSVLDSLNAHHPSSNSNNCSDNKNTRESDRIIFHIVVDETVNTEELSKKAEAFQIRNEHIIDVLFIIKQIDSSTFKGAPKLNDALSSYYRIVIDRLIPSDIPTVLYLDCDLIVRHDIRELFNQTDLRDKVLAACVDFRIDEQNSLNHCRPLPSKNKNHKDLYISNKNHFNAGVLLINMHEWRRQEIERKCFDLLKTYAPILHDQDLLNYLINDPVLLNTTWNFTSFYYVLGYDESTHDFSLIPPSFGSSLTKKIFNIVPSVSDFVSMAKDPAICHFTLIKPWADQNNLRYYFRTLPSVTGLYAMHQQWHQTAQNVVEFKDELLKVCSYDYSLNNLGLNILNNQIINIQANLNHLQRRQKRDKRALTIAIYILAALQLITIFLIYIYIYRLILSLNFSKFRTISQI